MLTVPDVLPVTCAEDRQCKRPRAAAGTGCSSRLQGCAKQAAGCRRECSSVLWPLPRGVLYPSCKSSEPKHQQPLLRAGMLPSQLHLASSCLHNSSASLNCSNKRFPNLPHNFEAECASDTAASRSAICQKESFAYRTCHVCLLGLQQRSCGCLPMAGFASSSACFAACIA